MHKSRGNPTRRLELTAPAKINLFLDVLRKRPDGYHDIRSVATPITLSDRIIIEPRSRGLELQTSAEVKLSGVAWQMPLCPRQDNLVMRAARLLQQITGCRNGARITLSKRIPLAAGLGGGSADAAATIKGLNTIWQTGLSLSQMMQIGAQIGCDIPALIHGGTICMEGVGNHITPVARNQRKPIWIMLVHPGFGITTGDIYARYISSLTPAPPDSKFRRVVCGLKQGRPEKIAAGLYNALQFAVLRKYPLLNIIKKRLEQAGVMGVQLSGSGPTMFALIADANEGRALGKHLCKTVGSPLWINVAQAL